MKKLFKMLAIFTLVMSVFIPNVVQAQEAEITYTIWDSRQEAGLNEVIDDFEAENPDIKVNLQVIGWDEYWTMLEAAATGGSLPDVFWMHSNEIYKYGSYGMLLGLDDQIAASEIVDMTKFPEGLNEIYNVDGVQYAIPKDYDTIGLWYNKTMFDEAGLEYPDETWDWAKLKEAAQTLTNAEEEIYGITTPLINQEGYYNYVYQNGGTILTEDRKSGYDLPETIEALEFYFSFVNEGLSPRTYNDWDSYQFLQNGQAAMVTFGSWQLGVFMENDYLRENFDVAPLPQKDGNRATIYNGLGNAISANTQNPEAAWKLVEYLSGEAAQTKAAELGVAISAYEGADEAWVTSNDTFNLQVFVDQVADGVIRPYTNQTVVWENRAYETLRPAYLGDQSVEEAANTTAQMMNDLISQE